MEDMHKHTTHPDLVKRLKRAEGHLRHVIGMIEGGVLGIFRPNATFRLLSD